MDRDLRPALPHDLAAIEAIVEAAYSPYVERIGRKPGPMLDDYAALIAAGRVHVVEAAGSVQGLLVLIPLDDAMLLDNVAVSPAARGGGYGRMLLEFAEERARAEGFAAMRLYTHELMWENIALYGRNGYAETHRAEERGLRRVYMRKPLSA